MSNIFEIATKSKFRYEFKGFISTEDLWDLSVKDLDNIYKNLNGKLKQAQEESLLDVKTKENKKLEIKIQIVKYIFMNKVEEKNSKLHEKERKEEKEKIKRIIEDKEAAKLKDKLLDELKDMYNKL